jgi:mannose-1-phosphate guanylyltransferase
MPIGARPVLELLLKWLRRNGVLEVYITTGYLGHLIRTVCGDGSQWNLGIRYTQETDPLGTIGPLSLIRDELTEPFLVLNGDVLTDLSLSRFVAAHHKHGDPVTIATACRLTKIDFGVIDEVDDTVQVFREKPTFSHLVSMGIYCMNPDVLRFIPSGITFGFDDLMLQMMQAGKAIHVYKHDGLWLDIGCVSDFQSAQAISWEEQSASVEVAVVAA